MDKDITRHLSQDEVITEYPLGISRTDMKGCAISQRNHAVWIARLAYIILGIITVLYYGELQAVVDYIYAYVLSTWVFNCVYFETWWVVTVYAVLVIGVFLMDKIKYFDQYKLDNNIRWHHAGIKTVVLEIIVYCLPLMLLDTVIVKRYCGVGIDPAVWDSHAANWIQYTRALPSTAPTLFELGYQLLFGFMIYDAMFYALHFFLHKNAFLYKHVHLSHHDHSVVHSRITNQLTVAERTVLVLSANQALKFVKGHPLSRAVFVILFVGALIENHLGYNFPWTLDKVVPFGLMGGSSAHYAHHINGARNYQPFFTYIDKMITGNKKKSS